MMNFNDDKYYGVLEEMNRRFPQKELDYRNSVVASIIAKGHEDKLTSDWLRNALLGDVEDEFMTYAQALYIKDLYFKAICEMKAMFS